MTKSSSILTSPHNDLVIELLNTGKRVSEVYRILKDRGIDSISLSALYRYKNSHFVPRRIPITRLYKILIETGNYNLLKSLERTQKIYETKRRCKCTEVRPEHLKRKGRVFIHIICGNWYPFDLGIYLKNRNNKGKKSNKKQEFVSASARSY